MSASISSYRNHELPAPFSSSSLAIDRFTSSRFSRRSSMPAGGRRAAAEHECVWRYRRAADAHISRARCCSFAASRPAESCLLQHLHTRLYGAALRWGGSHVCRGTALNLGMHGTQGCIALCACTRCVLPPSQAASRDSFPAPHAAVVWAGPPDAAQRKRQTGGCEIERAKRNLSHVH